MAKYKKEIIIDADSVEDASEKIKAVQVILKQLKTTEIKKVAAVVNDPIQLALIKVKLF